MPARQPVAHMSYAEYVAAEVHADTRHEYVRGEIYEFGPNDHARLESVGVSLSVSALYRDALAS